MRPGLGDEAEAEASGERVRRSGGVSCGVGLSLRRRMEDEERHGAAHEHAGSG